MDTPIIRRFEGQMSIEKDLTTAAMKSFNGLIEHYEIVIKEGYSTINSTTVLRDMQFTKGRLEEEFHKILCDELERAKLDNKG